MLPRTLDLEEGDQENLERQDSLAINQKLSTGTHIIDALDLSVIFLFFVKEYWKELLENTGRYVLFPTAAVATVAQAFFAWRQVSLEDGWKAGSVVKAIIETLTALAVCTAVAGGLTGILTIAPIIFAVTFGIKTLYQGGSAFFNLGKSVATPNADDKERFKNRAINFGVGTLIGLMATTAIVTVMIFAYRKFAILGIGAGATGASYGFYNLLRNKKQSSRGEYTLLEQEPENEAPEVSAEISKGLEQQPAPQPGPSYSVLGTALIDKTLERPLQRRSEHTRPKPPRSQRLSERGTTANKSDTSLIEVPINTAALKNAGQFAQRSPVNPPTSLPTLKPAAPGGM